MKKYRVKLNDKVYEIEMEEVLDDTPAPEVQKAAEPVKQAEQKAPAKPSLSAPVSGGQSIKAPMPGNIVSVNVKVGDVVKKDQILLVLEAMKMENEIVSPVDGKVVSVNVASGQTVNPGDVLVQIA